MDKTLLEIKEAEEEAASLITHAEKKAHDALQSVQATVQHHQKQQKETFDKEKKNMLDQVRKNIEKKRASLLKDAETQAQLLAAKAHKHVPQAVDHVIATFKQAIVR